MFKSRIDVCLVTRTILADCVTSQSNVLLEVFFLFKLIQSKCLNNIKYLIFILYVRKIPLILQVPRLKKKFVYNIVTQLYLTKSVNIKIKFLKKTRVQVLKNTFYTAVSILGSSISCSWLLPSGITITLETVELSSKGLSHRLIKSSRRSLIT